MKIFLPDYKSSSRIETKKPKKKWTVEDVCSKYIVPSVTFAWNFFVGYLEGM
jgi:hypothetical protein